MGLPTIDVRIVKKYQGDMHKILPFRKLQRGDKLRVLLECLVSKLAAGEGLNGKRLLNNEDVQSNVHLITRYHQRHRKC